MASKFGDDKDHPDFNIPWIQQILASPNIEITSGLPVASLEYASNSIFNVTLATPSALKSRIFFRRPSSEPDAASQFEECMIAYLGNGLDGANGRAHGGLSSLLLDQVLGSAAQREVGAGLPCATATLTVDYKKPVPTSSVVFTRAWVTQVDGRKMWTRGVIEDGKGKVYATAKALFIQARPVPAASL